MTNSLNSDAPARNTAPTDAPHSPNGHPDTANGPANGLNFIQAAFDYHARNWPCFPVLRTDAKKPAVKWKELQSRLPTDQELNAWFSRGEKNIGIATGAFSGFFGLDIDSEDGFFVIEAHGGLPQTVQTQSRPGRQQFWFKHPGWRVANAVQFLPGLDLRGDGGYVQSPPSIHSTGTVYQWINHPDDVPLADAPEWLLEYTRKKEKELSPEPAPMPSPLAGHDLDRGQKYAWSALTGECEKVANEPDGSKNRRLLFSAIAIAGFVPCGAITAQEIEDNLFAAIAPRAKDTKNALATIRAGIRYGTARPRTIPEKDTRQPYLNGTAPHTQTTQNPSASVEDFVFEFSTDEALDSKLTGIEWLWPGYIPRGFVTAIVADQDQGKSMAAQNLCDIVLRGTRWPDGTPHTPQPDTKLLWIDTEGAIALFHERLKQWEMPRGRFLLPPDPLQELTIDDAKSWRWIEKAIEKFNPPLVVIDALSGAHSKTENASDEMKLIMKRLSEMAQHYQIALIVIHHLNKPAPGVPDYPITLHRLRGSNAIPQFCRSVLALGTPDKSKPDARRLDVIKLNLARKPGPVGYELTDKGPAWGAAPEMPKEERAIDKAADFLEIALMNGPRESKEIEAEAKQNGIGKNALFDAKKQLKIKAQREGGADGRWFWIATQNTTGADEIEEGVA